MGRHSSTTAGSTWIDTELVIVPAWKEIDAGDDVVRVDVEFSAAFSLGDHATTVLSLRLLKQVLWPGATALDVGCGSGVLSVVAARLGAPYVEALDISIATVEATNANAERNGVADVVSARTRTLASIDEPFDVVVANLLAPVVVDLANDLRPRRRTVRSARRQRRAGAEPQPRHRGARPDARRRHDHPGGMGGAPRAALRRRSIAAIVGIEGIAPALVVASAPAAQATWTAASSSSPAARRAASTPQKASPAPVASTDGASNAGTHVRPPGVVISAPADPNVVTIALAQLTSVAASCSFGTITSRGDESIDARPRRGRVEDGGRTISLGGDERGDDRVERDLELGEHDAGVGDRSTRPQLAPGTTTIVFSPTSSPTISGAAGRFARDRDDPGRVDTSVVGDRRRERPASSSPRRREAPRAPDRAAATA